MISTPDNQYSLDREMDNLTEFIKSLNSENYSDGDPANFINNKRQAYIAPSPSSTREIITTSSSGTLYTPLSPLPASPSLPAIPSLPRSITNDADKPYDFLKTIEEESDSDDDEKEFSKVISKTTAYGKSSRHGSRNKNGNKNDSRSSNTTSSTCCGNSNSSYKSDSYQSSISKISESETLYCSENNINYKKFGHYISIEIAGGGKKIYDMVDIYNHCRPVKHVKPRNKKPPSILKKLKNLFK